METGRPLGWERTDGDSRQQEGSWVSRAARERTGGLRMTLKACQRALKKLGENEGGGSRGRKVGKSWTAT